MKRADVVSRPVHSSCSPGRAHNHAYVARARLVVYQNASGDDGRYVSDSKAGRSFAVPSELFAVRNATEMPGENSSLKRLKPGEESFVYWFQVPLEFWQVTRRLFVEVYACSINRPPASFTVETGCALVSTRNSESSRCCCSVYRRASPGDGRPERVPPTWPPLPGASI